MKNKIICLIPLAGSSNFFDKDYKFPKPLIEVNERPMIQIVLEQIMKDNLIEKFIFIVNSNDCKKYHLDNVLKLITDDKCEIIRLDKETKGAACSALMAIEHIKDDQELLICNGDQVLDEDFEEVVEHFRKEKFDAGVVTFNSVHPRWSYIRQNESGHIIETAEKRPISNKAIAGVYYFRNGSFFVESAMKMIEKGASVNSSYFIAPALNELILQNLKLGVFHVASSKYHSFYSPQKIKAYES